MALDWEDGHSGRDLSDECNFLMNCRKLAMHPKRTAFVNAMWIIFTLTLTVSGPTGASAGSKFDIASPASLDSLSHVRLWSTQYYVYPALQIGPPSGVPIVRPPTWSVALSVKDWCLMAVEGTGLVALTAGGSRGFNYLGHGTQRFTDCSTVITSLPTTAMERTLYDRLPSDAPYGIGSANNIRLLPFRSLAADPTVYPRGTVFFIPSLRSKNFVDEEGQIAAHDGYMIVGDVGGAIHGAHIDFFTGTMTKNPFPGLIKSNAGGTFDAYVITDPKVLSRLRQEQTR